MPAASLDLDALQAWCVRIARPISFVGVIGMLVVAGATLVDVFGRWLFNEPVTALNEVVSLAFAIAVAACIPTGLAQRANLSVDLIERWFGPRMSAWLGALGAFLLMAFYALVSWQINVYALDLTNIGRVTAILRIPLAPAMHGVAAIIFLGVLAQLIVTANAVRKALLWSTDPAAAARLSEDADPNYKTPTVALFVAVVIGVGTLGAVAYGFYDFAILGKAAQGAPGTTVILSFILLWAFLLGQVPLAAVMGLVGVGGTALFLGMGPSLSVFGQEVGDFLLNSQVAVLPLFLMMGSFANVAGLSDDIFALANACFSRYRGGLALATVGGCAGFGTVTGSALATTAVIGRIALPEMRRRGYAASLSTGCVAAGGTLGQLVPPSTALIIYALLTETSVGLLFVAAVVPAIIAVVLYLATIGLFVAMAPGSVPDPVAADRGELLGAARRSIAVVGLFALVIGGIYLGIFTATEAASVGAVAAFVFALARGRLGGGAFWRVMAETTMTTALIYGLIFGAITFSFFVGVTGLPESITAYFGALDLAPLAIIAIILLIYLALGSLMESFAIMVITVPIATPLILNLDYSLIWWGVVMVVVVETGLLTPPFGVHVFVLKAMANDVPIVTIFKGVLPFVGADLVKLALIVVFPGLVLWLPSTMSN